MSKSQGVLSRKNNIQQINAESKLKINKIRKTLLLDKFDVEYKSIKGVLKYGKSYINS